MTIVRLSEMTTVVFYFLAFEGYFTNFGDLNLNVAY